MILRNISKNLLYRERRIHRLTKAINYLINNFLRDYKSHKMTQRMIRYSRIIINDDRFLRRILTTMRFIPKFENLHNFNTNNRGRALKNRVLGLDIRPIRRFRNFNLILAALRRYSTKAAIETNTNTVTRPIASLNSAPIALTNISYKILR